MKIHFTKMQGLGNDFVVIDAVSQKISPTSSMIQKLANRHFGVGCDQVLLIESAAESGVDFVFRIFNPDGGEAGQCGNGARCIARFINEKALSDKRDLVVSTKSRQLKLHLEDNGQVTVAMGLPNFEPAAVPLIAGQQALRYNLKLSNCEIEECEVGVVSVGNPHAILLVESIVGAPVSILGPAIMQHPNFPKGTNVSFMEIVNRGQINLRVFERGTGETMACASGATASVAIGKLWGLLDSSVKVTMAGGDLLVYSENHQSPIFIQGPAVTIFEGEFEFN